MNSHKDLPQPPTEHVLFEGMAHVYDKTEADEYITELRAELARERERHQELRQVVKEYRISGNHNSMCRTGVWAGRRGQIDDRCITCIKADALLEPQPAPVATGEEASNVLGSIS